MSAKAVVYAETELGVHTVWDDTVEMHDNFTDVLAKLVQLRDHKRHLEYAIADREQELIQRTWADDPFMSAAKFDKHIKSVYHNDTGWQAFRKQLSQLLADIDTQEAEKTNCETRLKTAQSRMIELGGYLNYLAAVKSAQHAASTPSTEES